MSCSREHAKVCSTEKLLESVELPDTPEQAIEELYLDDSGMRLLEKLKARFPSMCPGCLAHLVKDAEDLAVSVVHFAESTFLGKRFNPTVDFAFMGLVEAELVEFLASKIEVTMNSVSDHMLWTNEQHQEFFSLDEDSPGSELSPAEPATQS